MISENFNKLLEIQMERYDAILKDCRPYVACDHDGDAALHKRIVDDVTQLQSLTKEFMAAAKGAGTMDEKRTAAKEFGKTSHISTHLWDHLYNNIDKASPFRRKALLQHAEIMETIRMEHITTNMTIGWNMLFEMLEKNKSKAPENKAGTDNKRKPGPNLRIVK